MNKDDYYYHYPKRLQLLDSDLEIKPDKWQMNFDGIILIGTDIPVFENFILHEDTSGVYKLLSHSNRVGTFRIPVTIPSEKIIAKEIWKFLWQMLSQNKSSPYVADGIFIYSVNRISLAPEFGMFQESPTHKVSYILRCCPKITYKDIRLNRDEKLKQVLDEEEI